MILLLCLLVNAFPSCNVMKLYQTCFPYMLVPGVKSSGPFWATSIYKMYFLVGEVLVYNDKGMKGMVERRGQLGVSATPGGYIPFCPSHCLAKKRSVF